MGEHTGRLATSYEPAEDDDADPGEIVWTWVPYEEDHTRGKDRPVLVVGRRGRHVLGLMLSSTDHDDYEDAEARHGRYWHDIGTGAWDSRQRPSEVRLDRVMVFDPGAIRREGARLDRDRFDEVIRQMNRVPH
ncbi:MAG: growth inhibitor PemK [Micrococcales bacterium]|nr:MAG: growth inhibitor PemK [Micrococcales bacterium]